jgi:hypothetical protein
LQAFTIKANGRLQRIVTDIGVCAAFDPASPPDPLPHKTACKALWDTGATKSLISKDLAAALKLPVVGATNLLHGGGTNVSPTYMVNFELPHGVTFRGALVAEFPAPTEFNVIVGMDVICMGDFSVTNVGGKTWVSFRTPPTTAIDYIIEVNQSQGYSGVGRNAPCPCGSGKKYKKCHGAL